MAAPPRPSPSLRHHLRILRVIAAADFQLKYAGSHLGYVWSVVKPLTLFTMLYLVFGRLFRLSDLSEYYPVSLLIGIVLFYFFSDATTIATYSFLGRESLLRRLVFPRIVIPTSATLTAAMTFAVNSAVIAGFVAWKQVAPALDWVLLVPLLAELYVFVLGISLLLAAAFIRLRDTGQVWELALQVFFYASPIIYPVGYLPAWARDIAFLNPFTQILQDIRVIVLYPDLPANKVTAADAFGTFGHLVPITIAVATLLIGVALFRRLEPTLAERV